MTPRRAVMGGVAAIACAPALPACSSKVGHEEVARTVWRHATGTPVDTASLLNELVRYATLAPSSHNTQCWKFRLRERAIVIEPDLTRRCPVVDPDDHHLFVSLGCAAENLAHAALAYAMQPEIRFDPAGSGSVCVGLEPTPAVRSPLFEAIPERQSTRSDYDAKPLSIAELRALEQAASGTGVRVILLTEREPMENVLEYVIAGNTAQMNDPAFVAELKAWIRFGDAEAVRLRDGLYSGSSGNPNLPRWIAGPLMSLFFTPRAENDKYARQVRSSAGVAIFVSETDDPAHWIEAGRCYERFALQCTALGIRNAFLNQPVEVAAMRPQLAAWLGVSGLRPDLIVRFGRGPKMPVSLRRPVEAVIV